MAKFALIGCGHIAKKHARIISSGLLEGSSLESVCDIIPSRAEQFAIEYGARAYTDMHEMMSCEDLDYVVILTESGNHAEHAISIAPYGKHILVEKPMALTLHDADQMIRACDEHNIKLFIVKQNRFNKPILKLKEALDAGRFGKLVLGTIRLRWARHQNYYDEADWRGTWALDGGVLTNQASHHIDLLEWMMGEVDSVYASINTAIADIEAEDTAVVTLKFRNGALGIVEATTAARPKGTEGSISVLGSKGTVVVGGMIADQLQEWQFEEPMPADDGVFQESEMSEVVEGYGHLEFYKMVLQQSTGNARCLVDGIEGRKSLELINAMYESAETGQEIQLNFNPKRCKLGVR